MGAIKFKCYELVLLLGHIDLYEENSEVHEQVVPCGQDNMIIGGHKNSESHIIRSLPSLNNMEAICRKTL